MSTPFDSVLASRPAQFARLRSAAPTIIGTLIAVVFFGIALWALVDFDAVKDFSTTTIDASRYQVRADAAPYLAIPVGIGLGVCGLSIAIPRRGAWVSRATGNRLRRVVYLQVVGDAPLAADLAAKVSTGDPAVFAPLPYGTAGGIQVQIYADDEIRTAYATVGVPGLPRKQWADLPLTVIEGAHFDALRRAETSGTLVRPADYTPLQGDSL